MELILWAEHSEKRHCPCLQDVPRLTGKGVHVRVAMKEGSPSLSHSLLPFAGIRFGVIEGGLHTPSSSQLRRTC